MEYLVAAFLVLMMVPAQAGSLYVVDGDTFYWNKEKIRIMGLDAAETRRAKCESERKLGYEAKARILELLREQNFTIKRHGKNVASSHTRRIISRAAAISDARTIASAGR